MIAVPLFIISLITTAGVVKVRRDKKAADPQRRAERQVIYDTAMNTTKDPAVLRELAGGFREEGMEEEADKLEQRAYLQELPPEVKKARKEAFKKAMASTDVETILEMADVYDSQGCNVASGNLRKYAAGLVAAQEKSDVQT